MNRKKVLKMVYRYCTFYKKKTIGIIMVLTFAFISFCIVNVTCENMKYVKYNEVCRKNGSQYFNISTPSKKVVKQLEEDNTIESIGKEWVLGQDESLFKKELIFIYRDSRFNNMENEYASVIKGKECIDENEIVVTESFLQEEGLHIGDNFEANIKKIDYGSGEELFHINNTFTIVGVLKDTDVQGECNVARVSKRLKNKIISQYNISEENLDVVLKNKENILSQINYIAAEYSIKNDIKINYELINALNETKNVMLINLLINICIMAVVGLTIGNLLYFNLIHNLKDYGIMKCIGIKNKNLLQITIYNVIAYLIPSIILGVIMSNFISKFEKTIIFKFLYTDINNTVKIIDYITFKNFIVAIVVLIIALIPSCIIPIQKIKKIAPITVVRNGRNKIHLKSSKIVKVLEHIYNNKMKLYAIKNLFRNKGRTVLTILTILFSILFITFVFADQMIRKDTESVVREYIPGDIYIQSNNYLNNAITMKNQYSEQCFSELNDIDGIKKVEGCAMKEMTAYLDKSKLNENNDLCRKENYKENYYIDDLTAYGVTNEKDYFNSNISINKGEYDIVITKEVANFWGVSIGDTLEVSKFDDIKINDDNMIKVKVNNIIEEQKFCIDTTGNIIYFKYNDLKQIFNVGGFERFDIYLDKNYDPIQAKTLICNIKEFKNDTDIDSFVEAAELYEKSQNNQRKIEEGFMVLMFITGSVGCFDAIYTSISNRKIELLNLNIIGIRKKELVKCIMFEGSFYCKVAMLIILPLQVTILIYLYKTNLLKMSIIGIYFIMDCFALGLCISAAFFTVRNILKTMKLRDIKCE